MGEDFNRPQRLVIFVLAHLFRAWGIVTGREIPS